VTATAPRVPPTLARTIRRGCAQLFVIFAARRDDDTTFADGGDFLVGSKLGGRNLIFVRDPFERNYDLGLGGPIADTAQLATWLRNQREGMSHVREVYTLGHSSGGYGALLFGQILGVDRAFAFSPRAARVDGAESARSALVDRLATHNGKTAYEICFSPLHEMDHAFAERLGRCPGVTLAPRTEFGSAHGVMGELLSSGELARMLPPFAPADAP
jgi:hypothetical protein